MLRVSIAKMIVVGSLLASLNGVAAPRDEKITTVSDQKEVAVTIYNDNLALIKDARRVKLDRDFNKLAWREVSAQMRPETALLRNLTNSDGFACRSKILILIC